MNYDMNTDAIFDKIEAWLSGELPESEAQTFEAEIAADAGLAAQVERHRRGRKALDRLAEQALQGEMTQWQQTLDNLPKPPDDALPISGTLNGPHWILGGLLLIVLGGLAYWFWPSANIESGNPPAQETIPPQTKTEVPVAVTPSDDPVNEVKTQEDKHSPKLIAMAEANLSELRGAILQQYGQTMGDDDEENPFFTAGVQAFKQNDFKIAKKELLQVIKTDDYFASAQEMLAFIYFREKNYPKAVQCFESYARQSADPATDWRLLQFYLADYRNRNTDFWEKLEEMIQPTYEPLEYRQEAVNLKIKLRKIGVQ